jgi:23S rRNA (uracil1939-C5)-methyltransferase
LFDLYCGTATLGMLAAQRAKRVIGIELNAQAVADGRANIALNRLQNIELHAGDVGQILPTLDARPDILLLDPPRAGLDPKAREQVAALRVPKIIYISCKPDTQIEDIRYLIERGYTLQWVQPVDQFPHTPHIENIALLEF